MSKFLSYWDRRLTPPQPNGQSQAAYWQECRKFHVGNGHDRIIAGELAWRDLENVKVVYNRVRPMVDHSPVCTGCGKPLNARRSTRKYCDDACRKRHSRTLQMSA